MRKYLVKYIESSIHFRFLAVSGKREFQTSFFAPIIKNTILAQPKCPNTSAE